MSFSITSNKVVSLVDSDGILVGNTEISIDTTFEVKSVSVEEGKTTAHLYSYSSKIESGDLASEPLWSFYGKYELDLSDTPAASLISSAENQIEAILKTS